MKQETIAPIRISLLVPLVAILVQSMSAFTLPVFEDSYSVALARKSPPAGAAPATIQGHLIPANGKAGSLKVSSRFTAYIRFEAGSLAAEIPKEELDRAFLMIYITRVYRAGAVNLHTVTGDWTEAPPAAVPAPAIANPPIAVIPTDSVFRRQFVIVDVTEQVRAWMLNPLDDFGIAFVGEGSTHLEIGAKEGPATGYPAVLQIERKRVIENPQIAGGIDAAKIGDGRVDNAEHGYLDGVTSPVQSQIEQLGTDLDTFGAELDEKVSKSGDTMTGSLGLPEDGLQVGATQFTIADGNVGIGTADPTTALEVRGEIKLGANGEMRAIGGDASDRMMRGTFLFNGSTLSITGGQGFTMATTGTQNRDVRVTFTKPFSAPPTVTFVHEDAVAAPASIRNVTASGVTIIFSSYGPGVKTHFIAIGPP